MNEFHDKDLQHRLARLGAIPASPDATRRALDRVRRKLTEETTLPFWRNRMLKRLVAAAAVLLLAGILFEEFFSGRSTQIAFAQVQEKMKVIRSVTFRQTTEADGVVMGTKRFMGLGSGVYRMEQADGTYNVVDPASKTVLRVLPAKKQAAVLRAKDEQPVTNLYEFIKNLPVDGKPGPVVGKKIEGKETRGFLVNIGKSGIRKTTVWVDVETRLPVLIETQVKDKDGRIVRDTLSEFSFDKELDAGFFSLKPPEGYTLGKSDSSESSPALVLALVQEAVTATRSVVFRATEQADGKEYSHRFFALGSGWTRIESTDGSGYVVSDPKRKTLNVNVVKRRAWLGPGPEGYAKNFYEFIKDLPRDPSAEKLPGKKIEGKDVVGFVVTSKPSLRFTVWADTLTRLPVRIEIKGQEVAGGKIQTAIWDQFLFDKGLDEKLFSLDPPAGFALEVDTPPAPTVHSNPPPLPGLSSPGPAPLSSPIALGTNQAQIVKDYGTPTRVETDAGGFTVLYYDRLSAKLTFNDGFLVEVTFSAKGDAK